MKNAIVVETSTTITLLSYGVIVAHCDRETSEAYQTSVKYSNTTTKHIKDFWLKMAEERTYLNIPSLPAERSQIVMNQMGRMVWVWGL